MVTTTPDRAATRDALRRMIRSIEGRPGAQLPVRRARSTVPASFEGSLSGHWRQIESDFLLHEYALPLDHVHGKQSLADLRFANGDLLVLLGGDDEAAACGERDLVFLDIETTGLGGAGTVAFLVTTGQLVDEEFAVRQYLATSPAGEGALLGRLIADIRAASQTPVLVTYNGRTFDAPVLDQRATMHRLRGGFDALAHVDLLRATRRGMHGAVQSVRLQALECELLGVQRDEHEIPGMEIPTAYFRFLRTGDVRHIEPVITHNALDVLSLAGLAARLAAVLAGAQEGSGLEHLAAGRLWLRADCAAGLRHLERARFSLPATHRDNALMDAALAYKRLRRHAEALPLWQELTRFPGPHRVTALIELAKHHEHRTKDRVQALAATELVLRLVGEMPAVLRRRERLLRQLARANGKRDVIEHPQSDAGLPNRHAPAAAPQHAVLPD